MSTETHINTGFDEDGSELTDYGDDRPVVDSPVNTAPEDIWADVEEQLAKSVVSPDLVLKIIERPGFEAVYDTNIDGHKMRLWRNRVANRKNPTDPDELRFCVIVLGNQLKGLRYKGVDLIDKTGQPVNFQNPNLKKMLKVDDALTTNYQTMHALYGLDGHMMMHARDVISAAGYDPEATDEEVEDSPMN